MKNFIRDPVVATSLCVLLWSLIASVAKLSQSSLDSYQFLFLSNSISLLTVLAAAGLSGLGWAGIFAIGWLRAARLLLLGLLDCLFYLAIYYGYAHANGVSVLVVQYSWPIMLVVIDALCSRSVPAWPKILGLMIGMAAIMTAMTKGHLSSITIADPGTLLIVVLGAACFAWMSNLSKTFVANPFSGNVWIFLSSTLVSLSMVWLCSDFQLPENLDIAPVIINGALINGLSYVLWIIACARGDASQIASLVFAAPVLSAIWLVLFFREPDVPPQLSSKLLWSPISNEKEIGCEKAFQRRADHRLPA